MAAMARSWHGVFGREFSLNWEDTAIRLVKVKVWHVRARSSNMRRSRKVSR